MPVDLGGYSQFSRSAIAYTHLKQHLGLPGSTRVYDVVQQLAQPEEALLDRFGIDVLDIRRAFNTTEADWQNFTLPQGQQVQFPAWFKPVQQPGGASRDPFDAQGTRLATMPPGAAFSTRPFIPIWMFTRILSMI